MLLGLPWLVLLGLPRLVLLGLPWLVLLGLMGQSLLVYHPRGPLVSVGALVSRQTHPRRTLRRCCAVKRRMNGAQQAAVVAPPCSTFRGTRRQHGGRAGASWCVSSAPACPPSSRSTPPQFTLAIMRLHRQTLQGSKGLSGFLSHPFFTYLVGWRTHAA